MKRSGWAFLLLLLAFPLKAWTQTCNETEMLRKKRISKIEFYHVSVGAGLGINRNFSAAVQLSVGLGSFRNVFNADAGFRYQFYGAFPQKGKERVSVQQLPFFLSANVNFYRWQTGCVYLGVEMAYTVTVFGSHSLPDVDGPIYDIKIGKNHFTPVAKIGCRVGDCDVTVYYEYDMKPSFNQKYVFETEGFDYDVLRYSMFERMRMGVRFLYHFNF